MPSITLQGISNFICNNINLEVDEGKLLALLGPTGSGKTTLLNIIAGLTEYTGSVFFDKVNINNIPANDRGIGYLFQDLALFPHLSVRNNIAFGLKPKKLGGREVNNRVQEMLQLIRIEHLAERYPGNLSGGERQRVALARALAPSPKVLLLDEPLSSLDFSTAKYLRMEFQRLQQDLNITTIYVTHNQREAVEIGDRIAVMHKGTLEQIGTPEEVFFNPQSSRISEFVGSPNILPCDHCKDLGDGLMEIKTGGLTIVVPHDGGEVKKIAISPRDIYLSTEDPPGPKLNRFKAKIIKMESSTAFTWITLKLGDHTVTAEQPTELVEELDLRVGNEVNLIFKLRWIRILSNRI